MPAKLLTHRETAYICRSLSGLLHAGIGTAEGCYLLCQDEHGSIAVLLSQLGQRLDEGLPFSQALEEAQCFPAATVGLIRTGEYAGRLEEALLSAAVFHETRERTNRQLKNAICYPVMLLGLMMVVLAVLLIQVLPVFDAVYASLGTRLTGVAAGLLQLGQWLKDSAPLWVILFLPAAALALSCVFSTALRNKVSTLFARLWDDRGIRYTFNNALFIQSFAMGIGSGLLPEAAMELATGLLADSSAATDRCKQALQSIQEGADLSKTLLESGLLPPYGCRMLSVGIRGGNADRILDDIAQRMLEDAESALQDRISKIEPTLVLTASVAVGAILLSVMLPLMNIMAALG